MRAFIGLALLLLGVLFGLGIAGAQRKYQEKSGISLVPEKTLLTIEQLDGNSYVVYPALVKTVASEWTAALIAVEPEVLRQANVWYTAWEDSTKAVSE